MPAPAFGVVILVVAGLLALLAHPAHSDCRRQRPHDVCEAPGSGAEQGDSALTGRTKSAPPAPLHKVAGPIRDAVAAIRARREQQGDPAGASSERVRVNQAGEIQVYVTLAELLPGHVAQLEALGLRVELTLPEFRLVQGWLPADAVAGVAALDFVVQVRPPGYPQRRAAGVVDTAGNAILGADGARAAFGVTGAGAKVGVLSDGVTNRAKVEATGDLPAGIQVLKAGSGDEGTAMLEIVHDLAPGAPLAFYAPSTSADMVAGINALRAAGARVAVDDILFLDQPKFEDGMIAQAARAFAADGRVYVTAAGNDAQTHYRRGYSRLAGQNFPTAAYPAVHNHAADGAAVDIGNTFTLPPFCSAQVHLQWNNRFGSATDDFDLFLARSSDNVVLASSTELQRGAGADPYEALVFRNPSLLSSLSVYVAVAEASLASPPVSLILDVFVFFSCPFSQPQLQYVEAADSVWAQSAVSEVLSVAAADARTPSAIQPYSSRGPGSVSFPVPEVRQVPNVTGVDCVSTQIGRLGFFEAEPFCGTSAAAPHVAALAALVMEALPGLSSEQYRAILTRTAVDLGAPGFDFAAGFGRAHAFNAITVARAPVPLAAAILPSSRSGVVGAPVTAFLTILNGGFTDATGVTVGAATSVPASLTFQTTDPVTNVVTGPPNAPVSIPFDRAQTFLIALTPHAPFDPVDMAFTFAGANTAPVASLPGVNTLLVSASTTPVPDVIALAATLANDGIVRVPAAPGGVGAFAVATANVGADGLITMTADTGTAALPIGVTLCRTDPATGECGAAPGPAVTVPMSAGDTAAFAVFVAGSGLPIPLDPAANRVFVRLRDAGGVSRGGTSVAVATF